MLAFLKKSGSDPKFFKVNGPLRFEGGVGGWRGFSSWGGRIASFFFGQRGGCMRSWGDIRMPDEHDDEPDGCCAEDSGDAGSGLIDILAYQVADWISECFVEMSRHGIGEVIVCVVDFVPGVIVQVVSRVAAPHDGAAESPEEPTNREAFEIVPSPARVVVPLEQWNEDDGEAPEDTGGRRVEYRDEQARDDREDEGSEQRYGRGNEAMALGYEVLEK